MQLKICRLNSLHLMIQNMTVAGTTIDAFIRTVSGTSINDGSGEGTDVPFIQR